MNRQMNQMSGGHRPNFTAKQGQYLAFIDAYTRVNRRPPAEADIKRHFGVTPPSVHQMILTLERAGLIRRQPGLPRSIEVLIPPEQLPVLLADLQPVKIPVSRY
jgi:DNA-binding MarR family transcriptional regulator